MTATESRTSIIIIKQALHTIQKYIWKQFKKCLLCTFFSRLPMYPKHNNNKTALDYQIPKSDTVTLAKSQKTGAH